MAPLLQKVADAVESGLNHTRGWQQAGTMPRAQYDSVPLPVAEGPRCSWADTDGEWAAIMSHA